MHWRGKKTLFNVLFFVFFKLTGSVTGWQKKIYIEQSLLFIFMAIVFAFFDHFYIDLQNAYSRSYNTVRKDLTLAELK